MTGSMPDRSQAPVAGRPWARVLIFLIALYILQFIGGEAIVNTVTFLIPSLGTFDSPLLVSTWPVFLVAALAALTTTLVATSAAMRAMNRRPVVDLGLRWRRGEARNIVLGLVVGLVMISAVFLVELAAGWLFISKVPSKDIVTYQPAFGGLALALLIYAASEEIAVRGYVLQNLDEQWGPWAAALISSSLFALAHGRNPSFGWQAGVLLVGAGLLFSAAYYAVRSLWMPIALHFSWNLSEGLVYGFPISGLTTPKVFVTRRGGPALFTGGEFGPEGGLVVLIAYALGFLAIWGYGRRSARHGAARRIDPTGVREDERDEPPSEGSS